MLRKGTGNLPMAWLKKILRIDMDHTVHRCVFYVPHLL